MRLSRRQLIEQRIAVNTGWHGDDSSSRHPTESRHSCLKRRKSPSGDVGLLFLATFRPGPLASFPRTKRRFS